MDQLLHYMESDKDTNEYLKEWKESEAYGHRNFWIATTQLLSTYINIQNDRRAYLSLVPYLDKAESTIKSILCAGQYADLIGKIKNKSDLSAEEKELIVLIKKTVATCGYLLAIPRVKMIYDGTGFKYISSTDGMNSKTAAMQSDAFALLIKSVTSEAEAFKLELRAFLYNNADNFPLWKADAYIEGGR